MKLTAAAATAAAVVLTAAARAFAIFRIGTGTARVMTEAAAEVRDLVQCSGEGWANAPAERAGFVHVVPAPNERAHDGQRQDLPKELLNFPNQTVHHYS